MKQEYFDKEKLIKFWTESADSDYETLMIMFQTNRYTWTLFIGHLMLEKLFKAYFVKVNNDFPPFIHNLL